MKVEDIRNMSLDGFCTELNNLDNKELEALVEDLFCDEFDIRKTLDEQIHCNTKMYNNYFLYEARHLEARAKYLYAKSTLMMRA